MDASPIYRLPQDTLHQIFLRPPSQPDRPLPIRLQVLQPHPHLSLLPPPPLRPASPSPPPPPLLSAPLTTTIVGPTPNPIAPSKPSIQTKTTGSDSPSPSSDSTKSLVACNPLTRQYRVLPQLGSAWSRHGSVLVGPPNRVLVLSELAALYFTGSTNNWVNFSSNLPSKPRSPILVSDLVLALCDVGSPWRSQWKLFSCTISSLQSSQSWYRLEKHEWGDVFDILKRPRLVKGIGNRVLMIGGLRSSFSPNASCSTILILRLDLATMEWAEAGRMPPEMFQCFQESSKFKVFGGGNRVCFSAKRVGRLALWDYSKEKGKAEWRWIEGVPGSGDGLFRGFLFEAQITALP
ncbi:F-box family protein [Actinidia rufa]|uniref:F-box family protein n=1 Tax=Actinidia rufa TaxID=165716 RepID=A0A7J0GGK1_9ERIC|nr:F-box family protein [Actinidia rufa]